MVLTIFSIPKPFRGEAERLQMNAVQSWRASNPAARIVLCGDDEGVAERAASPGVDQLRKQEMNRRRETLPKAAYESIQGTLWLFRKRWTERAEDEQSRLARLTMAKCPNGLVFGLRVGRWRNAGRICWRPWMAGCCSESPGGSRCHRSAIQGLSCRGR